MYEWILGIVGLFVVGVLFIAINEAYTPLYEYGDSHMRINESNTADSLLRSELTILDTIWTYIPGVIVFLFLLFIIIQSQRRTPGFD